MRKKILTVVSALLFSMGVFATAYAAKCSATITNKDGSTTTVEVEGSACTLDMDSGTCRCI